MFKKALEKKVKIAHWKMYLVKVYVTHTNASVKMLTDKNVQVEATLYKLLKKLSKPHSI